MNNTPRGETLRAFLMYKWKESDDRLTNLFIYSHVNKFFHPFAYSRERRFNQ